MSPSPAPTAIEVRDLRKDYRRTPALDGLNLTVAAGEVHGFLGPNGAGKSTTIRILLGLVHATSGSVQVLDRDPGKPSALKPDIAYVPGDVSLWPNLTGGEIIDLILRLRGGAADSHQRDRLIDAFDLDPRKKARTYSKGNRQKVALVAAFARSAPLYVLDEPTSGLDPVMEAVFREEVVRVRGEGATVLLSSHLLTEVEQLCDRVTIIRDGRAVESGDLATILRGSVTTFRVTGVPREAFARADLDILDVGGALEFTCGPDALGGVLGILNTTTPTSLTVTPPTLETLFLRHYQGAGR